MPDLRPIFGSELAERVLLYLQANGEAHTRELAAAFGVSPSAAQYQLRRLENGGVLVHRPVGRTKLYSWNPRWPYRSKLQDLLDDALRLMPAEERRRTYQPRKRPRRTGKPL